jgi:hypothetical protein
MYCVAVLKEFYHDTCEETETRLKSWNVVALEVGFGQDEIPSDTTLWRGMRDFDEDAGGSSPALMEDGPSYVDGTLRDGRRVHPRSRRVHRARPHSPNR